MCPSPPPPHPARIAESVFTVLAMFADVKLKVDVAGERSTEGRSSSQSLTFVTRKTS